jgi:hypothetical protein
VVTASGADCDEEGRETSRRAPARWRSPSAEFLPSFVALQGAVSTACSSQAEWEAKVAAGVRAALDFAAAEPAAAHALTIDARRQALDEGDREHEVVAYFARLLSEVAPPERRFPISTDKGTIEAIAMVVRGRLIAGTTDELPSQAPELVYLALMPYTGLAEARRWAEPIAQ